MTKFNKNDSGTIFIRKEIVNGFGIVFGVALTDLMQLQNEIDFDSESDKILEDLAMSQQNKIYQYQHGAFVEIKPNEQSWFTF